MANDDRPSRKIKDDGNTKSKKKNASPASVSGSTDTSGLRRSGRETSRKQTTASPDTRKSERLVKRTPPNTPPIMKSEKTEKQMITSPLRRSDRGKKHASSGSSGSNKLAEVNSSSKIKSKKKKVARSLKEGAVNADKDGRHERQEPDASCGKRKRMTSYVYKALFKPQRIRMESDEDKDPQRQVQSSQANSSCNGDVDKELKRPDTVPRLDTSKAGCGVLKPVENKDDSGDQCSDRVREKASERPCGTSDPSLKNLGVEADDQIVVEESDSEQKISFEEGNKTSLNNRRVEGTPDNAVVVLLVDHVGSTSSRKQLDGKSIESIGGAGLSSKRKTLARKMDIDALANSTDNHISGTSPSSGCKRHDNDETCLACSEKLRINDKLKEQQGPDSCDKVKETCEAAGVMGTAENDDDVPMLPNGTSSDSDMDSNVNLCSSCKLGGQLRYCDAVGCNRCYHISCLDPPVYDIPLGIWLCPLCVKNIESSIPSVPRVAESIWDTREVEASDGKGIQKQYLVKYKGLAHIHNQWVTETQLLLEAPLLVENFSKKASTMKWDAAWIVPQRLLRKRLVLSLKQLNESNEKAGKVLNYHYECLVKWKGLEYEQVTWESENALIKYYEKSHGKAKISAAPIVKTTELPVQLPTIPAGCSVVMDNIHLSYVKKLHDTRTKGQSSIIFDDQERVLRVVLFILSLEGVTQPFLLITTCNSLSQWQAMFLRVAPCNGFKVSIEDTEDQRSVRLLEVQKESGQLVFQVLLYPVDAFVKDLKLLKRIKWEAVVVDESQCSEISTVFNHIKNLPTDNRLLLFCGPLGENVAEYLNVLSLLGCDGDLPNHIRSNTETDNGLGRPKETLSQYIAFECKFDSSKFVEYWVPVRISNVQLEQYCQTLLNAMALRSYSKSDTFGALHDILVSNRKCCDHPYIGDPHLQSHLAKDIEPTMLLDVGIKASGKLQFLDLILPEMKKRQQRVLIFYQPISGSGKGSASVGDILDDYVHQRFGPDSYERVDGINIVRTKKQAALNNFNKDLSRFIFLLEYRACHSSIKLSSVDAIVIFNSDWNPANDLRALQKISIDSQSEKIMIFRLYTSCTLEEKILRLAEHNVTIDSKLQNLSRSTCDALLMWGASYLFDKLTEFHIASDPKISSEESFMDKLREEFLNLISHKSKSQDIAMSIITRVQQNGGTNGKNPPLPSELKTQLPDGEQPHIFWKKLLDGRYPRWKFISVSTPRQRKRPQYFENSPDKTSDGNGDVGKKRKKTVNNNSVESAPKPVMEEGANRGAFGFPADNGSQSSPADSFWSPAVRNERSLHYLLKPHLSKLCKLFKLSENVKITVERFLEYVLENYRVNREPINTLQAFLISLCWIGSSLLKHKIDRRESFALAKQHLSFSCKEEEANSVFLKLEPAKEMFLRHTENHKKSDASKDSTPPPQATSKELTDPGMSHSVPVAPKEIKQEIVEIQHNQYADDEYGQLENHKLSNEEAFQSAEEMPNEDKRRSENNAEKNQKQIEEFNREWDEKRLQLVNDYNVDIAVIRTVYSNPSVRSEKLKSLDKQFANKLEEHERMRNIHLQDLKATQLAAEGQMTDNCNSSFSESRAPNELHSNDSQHENLMVPSVASEHGTQDSPKNAPILSGNLMEVQSHDKAMHDMHPTLDVAGDSIHTKASLSPTDPNRGNDRGNAISSELFGATIEDQPNRGGNSNTGTNNVEANAGTENGEQPNRLGDSSNVAGNIESTSSHTSEKQMADATVSSVPTEEIPAQQHEGVHNDVVGHVDSVVMGVPAMGCNKDNAEGSTSSLDATHAREHQNDSGGSISSNSPSAASDRSSPTVLETQNESVQPQQLPCNGIQDKEGGQGNLSSLPDVDNMQPVDARQVDQFNSQNASPEPCEEPSIRFSTNPLAAEDQSGILQANCVLETTCEEATPPSYSGAPVQSTENHPSDHAMLQPTEILEGHPSFAAGTSPGEHQPDSHSSDRVPHQPSGELPISSQNPEPPHQVSAVAAEIPNQAASLPEPNVFNVQGLDSHNQVASQMPNQPFPSDPLQAELGRLYELKDNVIKSHEDTKLMLKSECEKELAEMIAQINQKYEAKRQDAEAEFQSKQKELDINLNRVVMNKILAEAFRSKCLELTPPGHAGSQQVSQAGLLQQLHRLSVQPSLRRSPSVPSSSSVQSSGSHLNTTTPPPLQVVHQPAALFSIPTSRPTPTVNPLTPSSTSGGRPPPHINPITPYSLSSRSSLKVTPSTRPPPNINSISPSSRPLPSINPITPASTQSRPPPSINTVTPSTTPSRPPPNINTVTPSTTPSRLPPSINSITPSAGNLRVSGEIRAPAPHIRPFRPSTSTSPPDLASLQRSAPTPHVPSSLPPFTSPPSAVQPPPPPPLSMPTNLHGLPTRNTTSSIPAATASLVQPSSQPPSPSPLPRASSLPPASAPTAHSALSRLPSLPRFPPPQPSSQPPLPPPPSSASHPAVAPEPHPPSSLPATTSPLSHTSSQTPLPRIPSVSTSHTGLFASPRPENGVPPLPTSDNLGFMDLLMDVDNGPSGDQPNISPPPPHLSLNFDFFDLTEFSREISAHSSSTPELVCLSDDD